METYEYVIKTSDKQINFSTQIPYVEAVLYYIKLMGLAPKSCTITYNNINIDPASKLYNLNHYKKNYLKIMENQAKYRSNKLFHVSKLVEKIS